MNRIDSQFKEHLVYCMKNNLAPIVLFVYNRLWHTQQTIEALKANSFANQSDLIIYSDGANNNIQESHNKEWLAINSVRNYLKELSGFKSIKIIERDKNWGLAANIIEGVSETVKKYGRIIVLEDDIVTSPAFLSFMNQALDFYKDKSKVWHISGWNYSIKTENLGDTFLWKMMNCWGWATWSDRWEYFHKDTDHFLEAFKNKTIKKEFNLDNSINFYSHLELNKNGKLNTWAIYWYSVIFENNGLSLNPTITYVTNIGFDGSGTNCGETEFSQQLRNNTLFDVHFSHELDPSFIARSRIIDFYRQNNSYLSKIRNKLNKWKKY